MAGVVVFEVRRVGGDKRRIEAELAVLDEEQRPGSADAPISAAPTHLARDRAPTLRHPTYRRCQTHGMRTRTTRAVRGADAGPVAT